eukprot:13728790-Alexandrium_andersonii.AAC.1
MQPLRQQMSRADDRRMNEQAAAITRQARPQTVALVEPDLHACSRSRNSTMPLVDTADQGGWAGATRRWPCQGGEQDRGKAGGKRGMKRERGGRRTSERQTIAPSERKRERERRQSPRLIPTPVA